MKIATLKPNPEEREMIGSVDGILKEEMRVAKKLVEYIDAKRTSVSRLIELTPELPSAIWSRLEMIGRGTLDQRLLLQDGMMYKALHQLPFSEQRKAFDDGVLVLEPKSDADPNKDIRNLKPQQMTGKQFAQVFHGDSIRNPEEQKVYLRNQVKPPVSVAEPYVIVRDKLRINEPCELSKLTLMRIITDMETRR